MPAVYADRALYDSIVGATTTASDGARVDRLLELASRLFDRAHGVAPGMFAPIASTALKFTPTGTTTLYLRDTAGLQCFLRTITTNSLTIDDDADGSFDDYTWDLSDGWVRGLPENASAFSEPYTAIELNPSHADAPVAAWPTYKNSVQITGTWGWSATPVAVQMRVVDIAHSLSQRGYSGGYGTEEALQQDGMPVWIMHMTDAHYNYRMPL